MNESKKDAFFKENYEFLRNLVRKRRDRWMATSVMEFEDLESILLTRLYRQLHHYDDARPLDRWANTVISRAIMSILRDNIYKFQKPCSSGSAPGSPHSSYGGTSCVYNLGGTCCAMTKSGQQDATCPLYKLWMEKRQAKFALSAPLSLEAHADEHHNQQSYFFNIEEYKPKVDALIMAKLSKSDAELYRLLYVKHYPLPMVMKAMGFRITKGHKTPVQITKAKGRFMKVFYEVVQQLDLPHHE